MTSEVHTTRTCKFCAGVFINAGQCPKFGLKFRNSPCPIGEVVVRYKKVKTRNSIPWWLFWKKHSATELIILN